MEITKMNERNGRWRNPSEPLVTGETIYPCKGIIGCKRYNRSKPAKYTLLYRRLCDFVTTYSYFSISHAGKTEVTEGLASK